MSRTFCILVLFVGAAAIGAKEKSGQKLAAQKTGVATHKTGVAAHKTGQLPVIVNVATSLIGASERGNLRKSKQVDETTDDQDSDEGEDSSEEEKTEEETEEKTEGEDTALDQDDEDGTEETAEKPEAVALKSEPISPPTQKPAVVFARGTAKPVPGTEKRTEGIAMKAAAKGAQVVAAKKENPELEEAKAQVQAAKANLESFNDDDGFADENSKLQKALVKETESAALGSMLGKIRGELRTYAGKASYGPQLEAKLEKAEQRVNDLEAEIAAEKAKEAKEQAEEEEEEAAPAEGSIAEYQQEVTNKQHAFSSLLLLLTFTQVAVFAMVSGSNNVLKKNAWTMVNTMAVVIIAATLFHVISILFEEFVEITHLQIIMHVLYALVLFSIALFGSYKLRNDPVACTAFKAVIFWIVLLAKSGAITTAQDKLGDGPNHTTMINFSCLGALVAIVLASHALKKYMFDDKDKNWYDDVEASLCGGAFGGSLAFLAHHWIDHHFPPDSDPDAYSEANTSNIIVKDVWAAITVVLAIMLTTRIANMVTQAQNDGKYWQSRGLTFLNSTIGIMPYFTVSMGAGTWLRHEMRFKAGSTGAHLIATGVSTFWGFVMIIAVSFIGFLRREASTGNFSLAQLMLGFGGYIAGYGWASLISDSIAKLNHGWGWSTSEHHMFTIISGLALNALAIPVYYHYLAPVVAKAALLKDDLYDKS